MRSFDRKVMAGMAVTILALATVAPFAEAGTHRRRTGNSDYYRGPVTIHRSYPARSYYSRSHSNAGPVLAGFFGGLILGAVLTSQSHQVVYRDPYCDRDFHSRQAFTDHCNTYHRSREVRIVRYSNSNDYYDDCQNRGYYEGGYSNDRTYDRDNGYYDRGDYRDDDRSYRNDDYRDDDRRSRSRDWDDDDDR